MATLKDRLPAPVRGPALRVVQWYRRRWSGNAVDLGDLRRTTPIDAASGAGRGKPIDRVYIERFLEAHRADIRGRALEVKSAKYVELFGSGIEHVDVLDVDDSNRAATIVADLQDAPQVPARAFDCVVLTQVLHYVYDVPAALQTVDRILAPGGVLLATVPGISRVSALGHERSREAWRFTALSARRLAEEAFADAEVSVETFGNVLTAAALLYGLAASDLSPAEIEAREDGYEVVIGIRAAKRP